MGRTLLSVAVEVAVAVEVVVECVVAFAVTSLFRVLQQIPERQQILRARIPDHEVV